MDIKLRQTQVTDQNRDQFYQQLYKQQNDSRQQLIDIDSFSTANVVAVDCCGWHYQALFPDKNVLFVDPIKTAKEFALPRNKIHKLIDNRSDDHLIWPKFDAGDCTVLFDRSPILKYKTLNELISIFHTVMEMYQPRFLAVRLNTVFVDSNRLVDRFYDLATVKVSNSIVKEFHYNAQLDQLYVCFERCYDPN